MDNIKFHSAQHLTQEELIEYSQGNLSNSEMHRLELHLVSCEFCNDALDGIATLKDYHQIDKSIEKIKLATVGKDQKELPLYQYIGIAASVLLIAVLGFVFLGGNEDDPEILAEQVQTKDVVPEAQKDVSKEIETSDNADSIDTTALALVEPEDEVIQPREQTSNRQVQELAVQNPAESGAPQVSKASIPVQDSALFAASDLIDDQLQISTSDSLQLAESMTLSDNEGQARAKKAAEAIPSEAEVLSEVVTQDYTPAEPEKGMRAYERYIKRKTEYPESAKANNVEGDVILRLTINQDGSVGQIEVTKSLGFGCDEEAIRLVREGGNWTPANRGGTVIPDTATITVSFKP